MTYLDKSKQLAAVLGTPHSVLATTHDLPALAAALEASALRQPSAELGYGCVDWYNYDADSLVAAAPVSLVA